jgi:hypothetical protein
MVSMISPSSREHQGAQHPHRIFGETDVRIADAANQSLLEILEAARVVDDRQRADVVEQRVDGEVAPERILFRGAVLVVALDRLVDDVGGHLHARTGDDRQLRVVRVVGAEVLLLRLGGAGHLATERRHLDRLRAEADVRQPETAPDDPAVAEQPLHFVGMRARADVEVLGTTMEQEIAYAAPYEVGLEAGAVQFVEDAQGIRVDLLTREAMFAPGDDDWSDHASEV